MSDNEDESREPNSENTDEDDVDLSEYPVGASPEVQQTVANGLTESARQGALSEVFEEYSPEQFNELVDKVMGEYREIQEGNQRMKLKILLLSVFLVTSLFIGLLAFVLMTDASGESLIFFAGTLAGYFMRLASEFY